MVYCSENAETGWCTVSLREILNLYNIISDPWSPEIGIHVGFVGFLEIGSIDFKSAREITLFAGSSQLLMDDQPAECLWYLIERFSWIG